jgi:hypothetical protein
MDSTRNDDKWERLVSRQKNARIASHAIHGRLLDCMRDMRFSNGVCNAPIYTDDR